MPPAQDHPTVKIIASFNPALPLASVAKPSHSTSPSAMHRLVVDATAAQRLTV
ncbi:MAG: hypothetical protein ACXWT1_03945 [Methylobacter sp.]